MLKWIKILLIIGIMLSLGNTVYAENFYYNIDGEKLASAICDYKFNNPPFNSKASNKEFTFDNKKDTWVCSFKFNQGMDTFVENISFTDISNSCEASCVGDSGGESNCYYVPEKKICSVTQDYLKRNPNHPYNSNNTQDSTGSSSSRGWGDNSNTASDCGGSDCDDLNVTTCEDNYDCGQGYTCSPAIFDGRSQSYKTCYENLICQNDSQCLSIKECKNNQCALRSKGNKDIDAVKVCTNDASDKVFKYFSNIDGVTNEQTLGSLDNCIGIVTDVILEKYPTGFNSELGKKIVKNFIINNLLFKITFADTKTQLVEIKDDLEEAKEAVNSDDSNTAISKSNSVNNLTANLSSESNNTPSLSSTPVQDGLGKFIGVNPGIRTEGTLIGYVAQIIRWGLGLIGTVFFVLVLMSGFNYMTAGDDSNKAKQSLSSISNATIGLILIIGSFLITNYILSAILAV